MEEEGEVLSWARTHLSAYEAASSPPPPPPTPSLLHSDLIVRCPYYLLNGELNLATMKVRPCHCRCKP